MQYLFTVFVMMNQVEPRSRMEMENPKLPNPNPIPIRIVKFRPINKQKQNKYTANTLLNIQLFCFTHLTAHIDSDSDRLKLVLSHP